MISADVIIVGSGPGGATLARQLARAGRSVLLLERGRDERGARDYGRYSGALRYADRGGLLFSQEGVQIVRPLLVGGATAMYCGCAALPPDWLAARYGVDVAAESAAAATELGVAPLAPELRGAASDTLAAAGTALGMDWQPTPKLVRPTAAFACGAHCMLGCRCGAKWSAASYVDDALAAGALLMTEARVERVLLDGRRAVGVSGTHAGQPFSAYAPTVVLCAGGIGTPRILQRSGMNAAGQGLTVDTTVLVYGVTRAAGNGHEPPMSWTCHDPARGVMFSTLIDPWLLYPLVAGLAGPQHALSWPRWGRTLGVMIKIADQVSGGVSQDRVSKPTTARDAERLTWAVGVARQILATVGAEPGSIFVTPQRGTHPGSSARIGVTVDADLATELAGLYVCDASVLPEALGQPTVLTIIGLARRLARRLLI